MRHDEQATDAPCAEAKPKASTESTAVLHNGRCDETCWPQPFTGLRWGEMREFPKVEADRMASTAMGPKSGGCVDRGTEREKEQAIRNGCARPAPLTRERTSSRGSRRPAPPFLEVRPSQLHLQSTYEGTLKTQLSPKTYVLWCRKEDSNP